MENHANVKNKRDLLVAVDKLIKRPVAVTEDDIGIVIGNLTLVLRDFFQMPSLNLKITASKSDFEKNEQLAEGRERENNTNSGR